MKKIIIITLSLILFVSLFYRLTNYTLVIPISNYNTVSVNLEKGDTINPFKSFDLNRGSWCAYIVLSRSDFKDLDTSISKVNCLKTNDIKLLKK